MKRRLCVRLARTAALAGLVALGCSTQRAEVETGAEAPAPSAKAAPAPDTNNAKAPAKAEPAIAKTVKLDASTTFQTWEGSGASLLAWDAKAREQYLSERWQQLFLDDMGMTVLRIDLLPTPLHPRGLHGDPKVEFGPDLEANVAKFDYDRAPRAAIYGELAKQLAARSDAELRFLASVWTPPHWLKDGAKLAHNGNDSGGGRLRMDEANLEQYARYMAAAITAWERRFEQPIYALSIQNEPRFQQVYSSMQLRPPEYALALATVATEFERNGMKTRFFGPEDVGYGPEGDHSRIDAQLRFVTAIMGDAKAGPALHAIAVHGYGGDGIDSRGFVAPGNWKYYWSSIEGYGKPSWQTETGGGPPFNKGPVFFANVLFEGMHYGQISMWCNWLFSSGGELDQHALVGNDLNTKNLKYSVAKHYFRFIRPGDQRVKVEPADEDQVRITAWRDPKGEHVSLVLLNMRNGPADLTLDLGELGKGRTLHQHQTKAGALFEHLAPLTVEGTQVKVQLPALSLTTLSDIVIP